MTIEEKVKRAIERHPDWADRRIQNSTGGTLGMIARARGGGDITAPKLRDFTSKAPAVISLADVRQKFDIPAAIKRELARLDRGSLLPEDELCRLTAGKDRNRFRRAIDNNPQIAKAHRIKIRLEESGDGRYLWGSVADIAEARRIYEM